MPNQTVTVNAKQPWSGLVKRGQVLTIRDTHGQQAVDFLCYDADNTSDRYSATNTVKVQGNVYVVKGTVLYADSGKPLLSVIEDTVGKHDTIYGCCSNPNNKLRYGVKTTESCYTNFTQELQKHGMDVTSIVPNVNWFMSVPVLDDGSAGVAEVALKPGSFVKLQAECNVLAVLSNCPQMHNPCNGRKPTPIEVWID
jgi:urea carboxylase-associated protein 1